MSERQRMICELVGMYICLNREDRKKYINIMKACFPGAFRELEWQE